MTRKKRLVFMPPEIAGKVCGTCRNWHVIDDEETAMCAVLAKSHLRGGLVKRQLPESDTTWMGDLERLVYERTMAATDGFVWVEEGGGEIVEAERFSGVPREYIDMNGEKRTVWSPLRTYAWATCSRWETKEKKAA